MSNYNTNNTIYSQYEALARQETDVFFGGRLADYKYYDMAPVIGKAMELANRIL